MTHTAATATAYVIDVLEAKGTATREDFDIPAIVTVTHGLAETWDFDMVDPGTFWNIAATFMRA